MTTTEHHTSAEQPTLPLELAEPTPAPRWAETIMIETEGNQDTGWWDA